MVTTTMTKGEREPAQDLCRRGGNPIEHQFGDVATNLTTRKQRDYFDSTDGRTNGLISLPTANALDLFFDDLYRDETETI